ncbi:ArsR family transcriptional regulator [Streptococcus iniae]|uniref:ArsR/SmtB family transcription factor n=1 Tax=Streptococcus iniae TaxID=1346 RepID=UPI002B324FBB|nr:ArsR family transcriptional regulator [Streptococcus iniae]WNZ90173.1 ArsR family transcriptional regulator [Streptococcus iniae]WNZ93229.1 ArsR family transcriptional regulator [Streptococcus iniae]WNZ94453.1 ArsR family transcriptional regulator [Streptococcus iniae]WNZ97426.1 ArsR family transcriptional regulator [Streptococcus iniae]
MDPHYDANASSLMEQLFMPYFSGQWNQEDWDFTAKERAILKDYLLVFDEIKDLFEPYRQDIATYYLSYYGVNLLQVCYFLFLERKETVSTIQELHQLALKLSEQDIKERLCFLLMNEEDASKGFWDLLENSNLKPDTKWYFSQFYKYPLDNMKKLIALSEKLVTLYQPYLKAGEKHRQAFSQSFSLEKLFEESHVISEEQYQQNKDREYHLYILSPWMICFASTDMTSRNRGSVALIVSCYVDDLLLSHNDLDDDDFSIVLKLLSDITRYKVMVELLKGELKSKEIAEKFGITGATVSFHTQKLINAHILIFSESNSKGKYELNKSFLNQVMNKLKQELYLDQDEI